MNDLQKLLDNGWDVLLFRSVDNRYTAAAKQRYRETWKDIFDIGEVVVLDADGNPATSPDEAARLSHAGPKMPHRIASGSTPEEAALRLVEQVILGKRPQ